MITVSINNEATEIEEGTPLTQILSRLQSEQQGNTRFAIAINGEFVARSQYDGVRLNQGDELDIVTPVGGG